MSFCYNSYITVLGQYTLTISVCMLLMKPQKVCKMGTYNSLSVKTFEAPPQETALTWAQRVIRDLYANYTGNCKMDT